MRHVLVVLFLLSLSSIVLAADDCDVSLVGRFCIGIPGAPASDTRCNQKPYVSLEVKAPNGVKAGSPMQLTVTTRNTGTITLYDLVTDGLSHDNLADQTKTTGVCINEKSPGNRLEVTQCDIGGADCVKTVFAATREKMVVVTSEGFSVLYRLP